MSVSNSLSRLRHRVPASDRGLAWLLGFAYVALLFVTDDMGYTRDESFYFHAAREYAGWFEEAIAFAQEGRFLAAFEQASIDRHWSYNPEHPVLVKTTFALGYLVFDEWTGWMSAEDAMRFPAMVFAGWLVAWLYLFTFELTGRRYAAVLATAGFALLPRWFFHAHLTCFDVPITAVWFGIVYAYWKSLDSTRWAWATGFLWGIGLITKLNAFFIPLVFLAHWALLAVPKMRFQGGRIHSPPMPFALWTMALVGPLVFYLGWPRHWFDTYNRIAWYLEFHLQHEHYFVWYFGQSLWEPPFPVSYPFVMTLTTTPLPQLLAVLIGAGVLLVPWAKRLIDRAPVRGDRFGTGILIALNIAVPFLVIAQPSSPVFGGIKHWFPALPYLAMVGGVGLVWVIDHLPGSDRVRQVAALGLAVVLLLPTIRATERTHPYGTSYYNEVVGGFTGAADRQGMRQFWGYAARGALPWLNAHAAEGARVHFHNTTSGSVDMYRRMGLLRDDLRQAWSLRDADIVLFHHQKSFAPFEYAVWHAFGTQAPAHVVEVAGVPMLSVYVRPPSDARAGSSSPADAAAPEPAAGAAPDAGEPEGSGNPQSFHEQTPIRRLRDPSATLGRSTRIGDLVGAGEQRDGALGEPGGDGDEDVPEL